METKKKKDESPTKTMVDKNTEDKSIIGRIKNKIEKFLVYKFGHIVDSNYEQTIVRKWGGDLTLNIFYYKSKYPIFYFADSMLHSDAKIWAFTTENELRDFVCFLEEVWKWWYKTYKNDKNHPRLYFNKTYRCRTEYLWLYKKTKIYIRTNCYDSILRIEMNGIWDDFSIKSNQFREMIDDIKSIIKFNQNGNI